jgi:hypothetical protein
VILVDDLDAFYLEHELCGDLDAAVEDHRVCMTCLCGAGHRPDARSSFPGSLVVPTQPAVSRAAIARHHPCSCARDRLRTDPSRTQPRSPFRVCPKEELRVLLDVPDREMVMRVDGGAGIVPIPRLLERHLARFEHRFGS